MSNWKYITLHCSATPEGRDLTVEHIRKMHKQRGFRDVGYHYIIQLDGTIQFGRTLNETGAHVKGFNTNNIGICYIGGLDKNLKPKDTRTDKQKKSLETLLIFLRFSHKGRNAEIKGHRDFSKDLDGDGKIEKHEWMKECPCFDVKSEYGWL